MSTKHTTGAVRKHILKSADITVEFASGAILAVAGENLTVRVEVASVPVISTVNCVITYLYSYPNFLHFLTTSLLIYPLDMYLK